MASSVEESSVHSPDSTVSSLLTSCSADSHGPYSDSLIHYKDKLYSSASEALEAYIEDFNLSLTSPEVSTGKICVCQSTPKRVKCSRRRAWQNRAAGDFSQRRGLDALASPSGRQGGRDPDLVSLVTDELLAAPADQSLPLVSRTPESRQQSSERNRRSLVTSHRHQTSSLRTGGSFSHKDPHRDSVGKKRDVYPPEGCGSTSSKGSWSLLSVENCGPGNSYPRWVTSQKAELRVSGLSCAPSFHYPAWLESHNLSSRSAERDGPNFHTGGTASSSPALELLEERHTVDPGSSDFFGDDGRDKAGGSCSYNSPGSYFQLDNSFSRHPKKLFT
ncbi:PREDICTED: lung adenoma susceptibility protein 2, partial [Buceros rhinoceros silvestris]|uniref:lung adenoma susceptibility protein 2 n=1 Tax=Buceros rhinoceros silvestris TaxID=175836 RepID=UPI00052926A9